MSSTSLRASVTFVDLATTVTHVVPIAAVSHVLMVVAAEMDTSGRYRYIQEIAVITDIAALSTSKPLTDAVDLSVDAQALSTVKGVSDSLAVSDSAIAVLIFIRNFDETLVTSDAQVLFVSPAYVETLAPTDTIAFNHSKAFDDGFAMNDLADAGGPVWSFSDTTANIVTMSDSSLLSNDKGVPDSVSMADSGLAYAQNYVDPTYLAQDYVGVSVTF